MIVLPARDRMWRMRMAWPGRGHFACPAQHHRVVEPIRTAPSKIAARVRAGAMTEIIRLRPDTPGPNVQPRYPWLLVVGHGLCRQHSMACGGSSCPGRLRAAIDPEAAWIDGWRRLMAVLTVWPLLEGMLDE